MSQNGLTARQAEVLRLVGEGLSTPEIAGRLAISPSGAKQHVDRLRVMYGVSKKRELIAIAREREGR